jgi:hypothetical protein
MNVFRWSAVILCPPYGNVHNTGHFSSVQDERRCSSIDFQYTLTRHCLWMECRFLLRSCVIEGTYFRDWRKYIVPDKQGIAYFPHFNVISSRVLSFWDMTTYRPIGAYWHLEDECPSKMSVKFYQTIRHHTTEHHILHKKINYRLCLKHK